MHNPKQITKQKTTADKKVKKSREEYAQIRMESRRRKEEKRTVKRAVKGQEKLKRIRDKSTPVEPDYTPYDGYYNDLEPYDIKRRHKVKLEWKKIMTAIALMIIASLIIAGCIMVLVGDI